jgi:hypothetical protein
MGGGCATSAGVDALASDVQGSRLRFTSRSSGTKLALKGKFVSGTALNPADTGAIVELRGSDGITLWTSQIAPESFTANRAGRRFRFAAGRKQDSAWNGLTRLDFRRNGSNWIVTGQAKTPALVDAALEPSLTLVVRLGAACVRRVDAECEQKASVSLCR